jgi:uncharacterized protein YlbG (UPF0298 family)
MLIYKRLHVSVKTSHPKALQTTFQKKTYVIYVRFSHPKALQTTFQKKNVRYICALTPTYITYVFSEMLFIKPEDG